MLVGHLLGLSGRPVGQASRAAHDAHRAASGFRAHSAGVELIWCLAVSVFGFVSPSEFARFFDSYFIELPARDGV